MNINIEQFTGRTWLLLPLVTWLDLSSDRLFVLTGAPGTGKSMVSAWLAGEGTTSSDNAAKTQLETLRSKVGAVHFCSVASGTTDSSNLAKSISEQLTQNIQGFSNALLKTMPEQIRIVAQQTIGTATDSSVIGVYIESLNMKAGGEASFNRLVREPLKQLYKDGYSEPLLLIIDSLDEAATYTGDINIVQLLTKLDDLPESVRFLVTTRPDPRILKNFQGIQPFDLVENEPPEVNDIRLYAYERLAQLEEVQRSHLANRINQSAAGIFLYANLVLNDLEPRLSENTNLEDIDLPKGLAGLYQKFLNRELGKNEDRWYDIFKPLLGAIAVAQGNGLTRKQLEGIVKDDLERELRICAQYLVGVPNGPFRVFHKSFADFLLEDEDNTDYHIAPTNMHRQIATYYQRQYRDRWDKIDDYGIRYLLLHLLEFDKQADNKLNRLDLYGIRHLFYHLQAANRTSDIGKVIDLVCEA